MALVLSSLATITNLSGVGASFSQSQALDNPDKGGTFVDSRFAGGLNMPTAMEFAPDGRLFVAEIDGNVRIIRDGQLLDTPFLSVPSTSACCERGLLGVTLDPNFAANGFVYVYYAANVDPIHNRVSRFTADSANPDVALADSEKPILDLEPLAPNFHNGGAIHFGGDGKLYVAVGDNYNFENAQLLTTRLGKILRINSDGSIPADNPFFNTPGARKEIWALGLRNPFTFAFSPANGTKMYINDVGNDWAEEINAGLGGANYGWPVCEGYCAPPQYNDPIYYYLHNGTGKAITGGAFYKGNQFPADYDGSYFYGDYVQGFIKRLTAGNQSVDFLQNATSPVDIDIGPDGSLYYLSIRTGEVHKVQYVKYGQNRDPVAQMTANPISGASPLKVTFDASGTTDPDQDKNLVYSWDFGDGFKETTNSTIVAHTYNSAGPHTAKLVVDDGKGGISSASTVDIAVGNPPVATIEMPANATRYNAGDVVSFRGSASDLEDGVLLNSALSWNVILHHNTHTHPFLKFDGVRSGNFTIPRVMEASPDVWFEISLQVKDSTGLSSRISTSDIIPNKANVIVTTSPPGMQINLDSQPESTPHSFTGVTGITRTIQAPTEQKASDGQLYHFDSWSDGGAQTHTISTPLGGTAATYSANYVLENSTMLTIHSQNATGGDMSGMWISVRSSDGTVLESGFTPLTFAGSAGQEYRISTEAYFNGITFGHWENGSTDPVRTITIQSSSTTTREIVATYHTPSTAKGITRQDNTTTTTPSIYFPLFAPPGPLWNNMLIYRQAHPSLAWIAVIDPHHGPGQQYDPIYAQNIAKLQANNVTVLGYVSTFWSQKDPELVKQDISKYKEWYNVDGIMLDEMVSFPGAEGLYSGYTNYAKSLGLSPVIGNVGTNTLPSYVGTVDAIGTIEGDRTPPLGWLKGWQLDYDKSNFLYITYSQSWIDKKFVSESAKYVGALYITDDKLPFPYDNFPAFLDEIVVVLDPHGQNDLRNLSVRASDLLGNDLNGTLADVSDATGTPITASSTTPLTYVGKQGSTYTVTTLGNQTYVFDHWDNGSTQPTRNVTLDSSTILRAYYRTPATPIQHSNIVVNALTENGGQLQMWTSITSGGTEVKAGSTPLVYLGQNGTTYTVTANSFQNLVFDHWEDGSRGPSRTVSLQGGNNAYLTAYYHVAETPAPGFVNLTVDSYTLDGTEIRGLWTTITAPNSAPAGSFTPAAFAATSGSTYTVAAQDSGNYVFDHWEDGSTDRTRTVIPSSDTTLTAVYRTPPATLAVKSFDMGNNILNGMYTTIFPINNSTVQNSFTNATYTGYLGSAYKVTASDYLGIAFDHWEDGTTNRPRTVMLHENSTEIKAYYRTTGSLLALTPAVYTSKDGPDLTVNATLLGGDGKSLNMWTVVQSDSTGKYRTTVRDYGNFVFDHWEDGSTDRIRTLTIDKATTITAYYRIG